MSHPDEGTIQMLLDGELDPAERATVEAHLAACASCTQRRLEAMRFLEEADRLVEVLAVPERPAARRVTPKRRAVVRTVAWAASIVMAVGLGYWGRGTTPPPPASRLTQEPDTQLAPQAAPPAAAAAPIAATRATQPQPEVRSDANSRRALGAANSADANPANEPTQKQTPPSAAMTDEREAPGTPSAPAAALAGRPADKVTTAWRVIAMEEAVQLLGGQLRLIDGLTPDRVETGPGTAVAGADAALPVVRVVYASGAVTLDEQRPIGAARQEVAAKAAGGVAAYESAPTSWQTMSGIRFVVTGSVSADSIRALGARVR